MEILSPASNMEHIDVAIDYKANAVYGGLKKWNARNKAINFDDNEYNILIEKLHKHNIKFFLTLNILVFDDEIEEIIEFLKNNSLPDAFIVTDIGLIQRLYEEFPNVRVFVLTPIQSATPERNVKNMKLINQVLRPIAGAFCAQVVDCYNNSGIIEKFEVIDGQGKYLLDGLHPAYNGQELQGKYVSKEIKNNIF